MMNTFSEKLDQFVGTKKLLRPKTYEDYVYRLSVIGEAARKCDIADREVQDITTEDLYKLVIILDDKRHFPGLYENTVSSLVKRLRSFFRWLVANKVIITDPTEPIKYRRTEPRGTLPFEPVELITLLALEPKTESQTRDCVIFHLATDTGLRLDEICKLRLEDFKGTKISVVGKGGTHRIVSIGEKTRQLLTNYIQHFRVDARSGDILFVTAKGLPLCYTALAHRLAEWGAKAGISGAAFHRFRVTFAVQFIQNGGDPLELQSLLGHSDLAMTRYYCRLAYRDTACKNNTRRSIVDSFFPAENAQPVQAVPASPLPMQFPDGTGITPEFIFQILQAGFALASQVQANTEQTAPGEKTTLPPLAWMQLTDQFRPQSWNSRK